MPILLLILILDLLVLVDVLGNKALAFNEKVLFTICILFLPIVGILIYYLFKNKQTRKKFSIRK